MFMLPLLFVLSTLLVAVVPSEAVSLRADVSELGYDTDVSTRSFEVLDVNFSGGRVLFRHIYRLTGDPKRSLAVGVDCHYEGLSAGEGELIGIYDLRRDDFAVVFPLRAPVRNVSACTSAAETDLVTRTLQSQLERFDLNLKSERRGLLAASDGAFSVPVAGREQRILLRVEARRALAEDVALAPDLKAHLDAGHKVSLAHLLASGRVFYSRYQRIDDEADVGREIDFMQVFVSADRRSLVVLERFYHRPKGGSARSLFSFSPVLDLTSLVGDLRSLPEDNVVKRRPKRKKKKVRRPREKGDDDTCTSSCCSVGCMACVVPAIGGACGCALCFDSCGDFERNIFGDDDDDYDDEIPPNDPDEDGDDDDDKGEHYVSWSPQARALPY